MPLHQVISYPLSVVNVFVAAGLIHLYLNRAAYDWHPPIKATLPVVVFFLLSNIYLVVAPFVPPDTPDQNIYEQLPYWLHCVVGIGIILSGGVYWLVWAVLLPKLGGYTLRKETFIDDEGWSRSKFNKEKHA